MVFARAFRRHVECPELQVDARDVGAALTAYFSQFPMVRSYALDEHGAVRKHVTIFIGDHQTTDRIALTDPVADGDTIYVFQALSGG